MIVLTPDQVTVLTTRLNAAEAAYDNIMIGGAITQVRDQNGEQITYSPANSSKLAAYIANLRSQLGLGQINGPLRPVGGFR